LDLTLELRDSPLFFGPKVVSESHGTPF